MIFFRPLGWSQLASDLLDDGEEFFGKLDRAWEVWGSSLCSCPSWINRNERFIARGLQIQQCLAEIGADNNVAFSGVYQRLRMIGFHGLHHLLQRTDQGPGHLPGEAFRL